MNYRIYGARRMEGVPVGPDQIGYQTDDPPLPGWSRKQKCTCCDRKIVIRCEGEPLSADDEQFLRDMSH